MDNLSNIMNKISVTPVETERRKKVNTERAAATMRLQQKAKEERKKAKAQQELNAINNIASPLSLTLAKKESPQKENAKWKHKRYDRYQEHVWKGWKHQHDQGKL